MTHNAPSKHFRSDISIIELMDMLPDEDAAHEWFESVYWPEVRCCWHCGSVKTSPVKNRKPMP